jgi:hypothetical protein
MKFIKALIYCLCGLFSTLSEAAPVRWNFPGTVALSGNYTISGSFTGDLDSLQLTSSDILFKLNGNPVNLHGVYGIYYGTFGNVTGNWIYFVAGNTVGVPAMAITYSTLTNAGGSADVYLVSGTCSTVRATDNVCTGFTGQVPRTVTLTGTPVPSIPALSQWAMIFLASLMGIWASTRVRRL